MSALSYLEIDDQEDEGLSFVKALYESAFPVQERREWTDLLSLIGREPEMRLEIVKDEEEPVAFVVWWQISDWMFIEHLAVSSTRRGKNYGSRIMDHYLALAQQRMLLEVEPPLTEEAQRRIRFYEKLGLNLLDYAYEQPSYNEKGVVYPMCLMSTQKDLTEDPVFLELTDLFRFKVYLSKQSSV